MHKLFNTLLVALSLAACNHSQKSHEQNNGLTGEVKLDGSSTVYPIAEAVAEDFGKENAGVKVTIGVSGSGGGIQKIYSNRNRYCRCVKTDRTKRRFFMQS